MVRDGSILALTDEVVFLREMNRKEGKYTIKKFKLCLIWKPEIWPLIYPEIEIGVYYERVKDETE